ncbi:translocation/assembly module TamB domain-containing protein [Janthinobacterium agaricidamnosum]|uniref:Translocation and assembly module TamB C-terminal domain-containing protein n=1 Tax=Janthinobacterium agaricidamnosum NBRC 102515 = DSM 9628 TaxID=1349767 RepID=W0VDC7_9BURK|nr:translocation/assembly module TamB domain-containing protein [Janthinobacterium agaricidamnosum]CDG85383.1 conserved hypothetical protein [Janthinobacterium agaricidamnosum NBRC 102515 = DSM 9628]
MSDTTPPTPPDSHVPAPAPQAARRWPRYTLIGIGSAAVLLGGALWLLGRESTLQALLDKVSSASGGQIVVSGVSGSLYNKMHLGHVSYRGKSQTITAENIDINWSPLQFFSEGIAISELHVASMVVKSTGPSEPSTLPTSLAAPFQLSIADARLDKITLQGDSGSNVIEKVHFNLSGGKTEWRLQDASAITPWGAVTANASVATNAPFKLDGKAGWAQSVPAAGEKPAALTMQVGGDLALVDIKASGSAGPASADAHLALAPFDPVIILRSASIQGRNINPGRYDATWPQAELSLDLDASIGSKQEVSGKLAISNTAAPGPLDRQRLPLHSISAQVGGTLTATTITSALLDFAQAGKFTGSGSINRDAADGPVGSALFTLHTDKIDLKAIQGSLNSTHIAGDIKLGSDGKTHTVSARLAELGKTTLRLDVQASLLDSLLSIQQARLQAGKGQLTVSGQASLKDAQQFKATASASRFNPADFGAYPVADLNAAINVDGHVAPQWLVNADVALRPSRLLNQPLSGAGKVTADARHVSGVDARLALGRNSVEVRGNFGAPGERLNWTVDARQLSAAHSDLLGSLNASGVASGTLQEPRSTFVADAKGLGLSAAKRPGVGQDSVLHASGEVGLSGAKQVADLKLTGSAQKFNPAAFGAYPSGNINADFNGGGRLGGDWKLALNLALQPASTLQNVPLTGYAKVSADASRIDSADIDLHLGPNSMQARGSFGGARDKLDWKLDAPQLASLGAQFGGVLHGNGALSGSMKAPALSLNIDGQQLRFFGEHQVKALRASASLGAGQGAADPLVSDIDVTGYSSTAFKLASARLSSKGTLAAHSLQLTARNDDFDVSATVKGGLNQGVWLGSLDALQNRGRFALALQAPAPIRVAGPKDGGLAGLMHPEQISVSNAVIKLPAGSISLQSLEKAGPRWASSGQAAGVPLNYLTQAVPDLQQTMRSDMTLGAQWNLDLRAAAGKDPALAGMLHVFREKGDITVGSEQPLLLGLRTLDARADVANSQLRMQVALDGARSGQVRLDGTVQMQQGRIAGDSPLNLTGSIDMPSLAWLGPLTGQAGLELGGALKLALTSGGTIAAPSLNGDLSGDKLVVNWADQGLKLRNGVLQAKLAGDQLQLQRLAFDGGDGKVQADGWVRFANAEASMELKLVADKLQALARPDRTLVLSGSSTLVRNDKRFSFEGKFKADRATIELASQDTPTQSDDVVVLGKAGKGTGPGGAKAAPSLPLNIDLEADLGNRFHLKGMGLDADLGGNLRIRVLDRRPPRITGSIRVDNGNYAAYGQKLSIERGVINFTGAYDNPGLNILAVRKRPEGEALSETNVEAGVEVRGTAQAPTAKLVSTPSVSDSDKLAWLILGHGTEGTAGDEMGLLTTAAGALFGGTGGGMQGKLANSLGLDEVGLSQAKGLESTVVTVGKRISSRAYLSFEQGASSASSLVKLRYKWNRRITLQFQTGTNNALDVLYTWAFD